ncbi:hypothetical protein [Sorangium cellulosum]|uniref:hypothetical protein n=1 Tax=Sorangium cellulosum TaxID=56 RepID=UPI0012FF9D18|nr:hypothetical protein [Sorangium cellulosum]
MKPRDPKRRVRVTVPGKPVTRSVTPEQIDRYLEATGWVDDGLLPARADRSVPLTRIIAMIAMRERRSPGEVLADIAAGRGPERHRSRLVWRTED